MCFLNALRDNLRVIEWVKQWLSVRLVGWLCAQAGDPVLMKVVPLDRFANAVDFNHSATQLKYELNATLLNSASDNYAVRGVLPTLNPKP